MSRLISVAFTEQQVIDQTKDVSRRKGWWEDKNGSRLLLPGERLTCCRKVMGRKKDEPLVKIAEVEALTVWREPLTNLLDDVEYGEQEMIREGFPGLDPLEFINRYFVQAQGMSMYEDVTRIQWIYLWKYSNPQAESMAP